MTFNSFREIISEISHVSIENIEETSSFREDLAIDSLQLVNLIVEVSERFGIDLGMITSSQDFQTVGNLYRAFFRGKND